MRKPAYFILLGVAASLQACSAAKVKPQLAADDALNQTTGVVAEVNGQPITDAAVKNLKVESAMYNRRIQVPRDKLIDELVDRELLYQEALSQGFDKLPAVAEQIKVAERTIVSKAYMRALLNQTRVTREEIRAEYDKRKAEADFRQFRLRHILVSNQEQARQALERLQKGDAFDAVAREMSKDHSGANGGELGWRGSKQLAPEIATAVKTLKPGEYTRQPVQSSYGWHIVQLEEVREQQPPSFEQVEHSLASLLKRKKLKAYLNSLKQKSKVVITEPTQQVAEHSKDKLAALGAEK